jgi:hypothetical protein
MAGSVISATLTRGDYGRLTIFPVLRIAEPRLRFRVSERQSRKDFSAKGMTTSGLADAIRNSRECRPNATRAHVDPAHELVLGPLLVDAA